MEYENIARERVPALGLGTWELTGEDCRKAVPVALDLGYRHIDTAQVYGNEGEIGDALAASDVDRDQLWITTKIWNDRLAAAAVRSSTEESLRKLRTDHVDLLLVHWPVEFGRIAETLEAVTALREEGKTRFIGVSNFSPRQFERAAELAPVVCNQVEYHPFLGQGEVLDTARKHDAVVTAYSPLARGAVLDDPVLGEIARDHDRNPVQVTLRWLLDQPGVVAVPKATGREHLAANMAIFDFELSEAERRRIDRLARGERIIDPDGFGTDWG